MNATDLSPTTGKNASSIKNVSKNESSPPDAGGARRLAERAGRVRELGLLVALALVVGAATVANPRFLNAQSAKDLLLNAAITGLLAVGMTVVVVTRNVDLSVSSVLGLSAFAVANLFATHPGLPIPVGVLAGVGLGAALGLVNGALVGLGRVPSLVVTLGTLYVIRGVDYAWAHGRQINAADLPDALLRLGSGSVLGLPYLPLVTVAVLLAATWWLRAYRSGRELYAIGSNPDAARLAGIRTGRRVLAAFVANGALAGLAGVLWTARFGTVDAAAGTGFELAVVAAVVVGGVNINGGVGTPVGAVLGALLLSTIGSALIVLHVPSFWQQAINGALLLGAIGLDRWLALRLAAGLRRQRLRGRPDPAGAAAAPEAPGTPAAVTSAATTATTTTTTDQKGAGE